jgi:sugar (pentulose or hexulose) kinase
VSGAPVADAFLAGLGVGIYEDFGQIRDWVSYDASNEPDPESHAVYRKLYQIYRNLYVKTKDDMHVLADMA